MPLDFRRATDLFLGREAELAQALRIDTATLRQHREQPGAAPSSLLHAVSDVLDERGRAMVRVAEMLRDQAVDAEQQGNGRGGA
jgi:hypothetical protein